MRDLVRSGLPVFLAAMALGVAYVLPAKTAPAVDHPRTRLLATYLIPPTKIPILAGFAPPDFLHQLAPPYITATYGTPPDPIVEVDYPAELFSSTSIRQGLAALQSGVAGDPAPVIFGYSQGAEVISLYKQAFNAQYANPAPGATVPTPTYVVIGSPSRPNGGISTRLSFLGVPPVGGTVDEAIPTPTETAGAAPGQITTYDFVNQYDSFADFPSRPLNLLALANAVLGAWEHATYGQVGPNDILQQRVGDTAYYLRPTPVLPLLQPLAAIGVPAPIIAALDAPLRVLVEAGYDRSIGPGTPVTVQWAPVADPVHTAINVAMSIPTGLDDALQLMGRGRPFGTAPAGPYGVGGPPTTLPDITSPAPLTRAAGADTSGGKPSAPAFVPELSSTTAESTRSDPTAADSTTSHPKRVSAAHETARPGDDDSQRGVNAGIEPADTDTSSSTSGGRTQTKSSANSNAGSSSTLDSPTSTPRSDTDGTGERAATAQPDPSGG